MEKNQEWSLLHDGYSGDNDEGDEAELPNYKTKEPEVDIDKIDSNY